MVMSLHTSAINAAVVSLMSSCLRMVHPPQGHESACSMLLLNPHTQLAGRHMRVDRPVCIVLEPFI